MRTISIKLLLPFLLVIMSGMLCLLVSKMPLVNSKILLIIFSIPLVISPLFTLMTFLFIQTLLMNTENICTRFWKPSNVMVLLFMLRKSNYFRQKFVSLVMISLKDKFILLIEPFSLLINFLMLLLIKPNSRYFLDPSIMLLISTRTWEKNVNLFLTDYRVILHLGLMSILPLLNKSNPMWRHCHV